MNLLPKDNKAIIKKGFKVRFIIVSEIIFSILFLVGIFSLVPAYLLAKGYFDQKVGEVETKEFGDLNLEIMTLPGEVEQKIAIIEKHNLEKSSKFYIDEVIKNLPDEIILNSIIFIREAKEGDKNGVSIKISGLAETRNGLISYVAKIKENEMFTKAEIPVSDLTKEKNLMFTVNIFIEK